MTEQDKKELAWEEVSTEHIVRDEWIDFRKSAFQFPDGTVYEPFYTYSRRDYVVIVATDEEGRYLCVKQFRQGIRQVTTEFPAGGIERTDGKSYRDTGSSHADGNCDRDGAHTSENIACGGAGDGQSENARETAKRELLEETGYVSDEWQHLITVPSNATISDNYVYIFKAVNCRRAAEQHLDKTEFLNVEKRSEDEIRSLIQGGEFQQAMHIMAWLLAK